MSVAYSYALLPDCGNGASALPRSMQLLLTLHCIPVRRTPLCPAVTCTLSNCAPFIHISAHYLPPFTIRQTSCMQMLVVQHHTSSCCLTRQNLNLSLRSYPNKPLPCSRTCALYQVPEKGGHDHGVPLLTVQSPCEPCCVSGQWSRWMLVLSAGGLKQMSFDLGAAWLAISSCNGGRRCSLLRRSSIGPPSDLEPFGRSCWRPACKGA